MNTDIDSALDGLASIVVGGYVISVLVHGNQEILYSMLLEESGFLEFCVSILLIKIIIDYDKTGAAMPIVALAVVAAVLNVSGKMSFTTAFKNFGNGKTGLFQTISTLFGR